MAQRRRTAPTVPEPAPVSQNAGMSEDSKQSFRRPPFLFLALLILSINGSWAVYHFQFKMLPVPLSAKQAGKRGFSEELAMQHVKALTKLGPHPVGTDALDLALQVCLCL